MRIGHNEMVCLDGNRSSVVKKAIVWKSNNDWNVKRKHLNPLGYPSLICSNSKIDLYWFKSQKDGGCLKYLFLNNENYDVCLPPYLWINKTQFDKKKQKTNKVCTISFERPVNCLCDAWHVFPPKYEAWTHFNRPWTEYQCQRVVWTLLIILTESVNWSTCLSVCLIITRLRNVNLLCFSDSIEDIDFLYCTLKCPVTLKLANQNRCFY